MKNRLAYFIASFLIAQNAFAQSLANTAALALATGDERSKEMLAGIDKFAMHQIEKSRDTRQPSREKLGQIFNVGVARVPFQLFELVGNTASPALLYETAQCSVFRVRWPIFDGLHGEGIYVKPKQQPLARVIYFPDAAGTPEKLVDDFILTSGCEVVIPALVDRTSTFSGSERFGIKTNVSHREWIYRQAFTQGRHIAGYEIQSALALVDWFTAQPEPCPILVAGVGEGGGIALRAAALDERIGSVYSAGFFGTQERTWEQPLDRNVFGILSDFGDAEIASLIAPRPLAIEQLFYPTYNASKNETQGARNIAAPGKLSAVSASEIQTEIERARKLASGSRILFCSIETSNDKIIQHLLPAKTAASVLQLLKISGSSVALKTDATRQARLVREMADFTQKLIPLSERERDETFWKKLPLTPLDAFEKHVVTEREHLWKDVLGKLPDPSVPMNPRTRLISENDAFTVHEVLLDVWPDVTAWGYLLLPKNMKPGEKRPVIVCQHGLEGLPEDVVTENESDKAWRYYKGFAARLAREGFITFAPHNFYRGHDDFRVIQRKLNPVGKTLFSVVIGQHQRILEWLKTQPNVDEKRIAFYGLSYGGKSAMRIPAVLTDYCLSICSGDFNEWVRKCVSTDMLMSYVFTPEYEIWEPNLGRTFNYAEMAALIAPRPFMVERGHNDGVGTDEWVSYEYAKVRRLYDKLGVGERTQIEFFDGPHRINGKGTFEFLRRHLNWPKQ